MPSEVLNKKRVQLSRIVGMPFNVDEFIISLGKFGYIEVPFEYQYSKNIYFVKDNKFTKNVTVKLRFFDNNCFLNIPEHKEGRLYDTTYSETKESGVQIQNKTASSIYLNSLADASVVNERGLVPAYLCIYKRIVLEDDCSRITIDNHKVLSKIEYKDKSIKMTDPVQLNTYKVEYKFFSDNKNEEIYSKVSSLSDDTRTNLEIIKDAYAI